MPTEVSDGARAISDTTGSMGIASDDNMKSGAAPNTVRTRIVAGIPQLKLILEGAHQRRT
jgi:hypothetical protein